jgi:multiple sugar transport system permease protein
MTLRLDLPGEIHRPRRGLPLGWLWHVVGLAIAAIMLGPFVWMILSSFKSAREIIKVPPQLLPIHWTLNSYQEILEKLPFPRYYLNSMIVSTSVTAIVVVSSSLLGFVFAKYQFWGKDVCFTLILSTLMVPFAVVVVPLYTLVSRMRMLDSYGGLILPICLSSFGIFLMRQFMEGIPTDLVDAARIDGAGDLWIWARIMVPLSMTATSALAVFTFLWSWNLLWWPVMVINSTEMRTLPLGIVSLAWENGARFDLAIAGASVAIVPVMVLFALAQKTIVRGVALTGMKG